MKTLLVVDGNNIAHRCRYKFQLDNNGTDVSVTFGFLRVLLSYIRKHNPTSVIVAWDGGLPPYRRERVPAYKANRNHGVDDPLAWEDFLRQMHEIRDVSLPLMGVASVWRKYIEADDLAFHAAAMAQDYDKVIIASNDKDLLQCCRFPNTVILDPAKDALKDATWVEDEYNIKFDQYVYWRALQGDSSDNIAGVNGIGPATATKLFKEYQSISSVYNAANDGKLGAIGTKIVSFGWQNIVNNVYVMVLGFDRSGARKVLSDGMWAWEPADISKFKRYLMQNAFMSLLEPVTYTAAKKLQRPDLSEDLRIPVIYGYRNAAA